MLSSMYLVFVFWMPKMPLRLELVELLDQGAGVCGEREGRKKILDVRLGDIYT